MIQLSPTDLLISVFLFGYAAVTLIKYLLSLHSIEDVIDVHPNPAIEDNLDITPINPPPYTQPLHPLPRKYQSSPSYGVVVYSSIKERFNKNGVSQTDISFTPSISLNRVLGDKFRLQPPLLPLDRFPGSTSTDPASLAVLAGLHRSPGSEPPVPKFIRRHPNSRALTAVYNGSRAPCAPQQRTNPWRGRAMWRSFSPFPSSNSSEAERSETEKDEDEDEEREHRNIPTPWTYQLLRLPASTANSPPSIYLDCTTPRCSKRLGFDMLPCPADRFWQPSNANVQLCTSDKAWKSVLFHLVKWDLDPQIECFDARPYDYEEGGVVCQLPTVDELGEIVTQVQGTGNAGSVPVPTLQAFSFVGRESGPTPLRSLDFREVEGAFKLLNRIQLRNVLMTMSDCWEMMERCPSLEHLSVSGELYDNGLEDCVLAKRDRTGPVRTSLRRLDITDRCNIGVARFFEGLAPERLDTLSLSLSSESQNLLLEGSQLLFLLIVTLGSVRELMVPAEDSTLHSRIRDVLRTNPATMMRICAM
ncbi:hypothetical protein PM082_002014 [Marasmius tenuissimus]|nr:hypothetical protein PM082_002014 [Marasmius tenuissimus]